VPLGTIEVGLDPGDIVLDGDAAAPKRGTAAPHFRGFGTQARINQDSCLLWPNG